MNFFFKSYSNFDVVIFGEYGSAEIKKYLLPDNIKSIVLKPRRFKLNFKILYLFILNFIKLNRDSSFLKFLYYTYIYSLIEYYNPSIVITFTDNSSLFHWQANNYNGAKFYAIQNGYRSKLELSIQKKFKLTNFFTFGESVEKQYRKYGHSAKKFIPVGSFLSSIFVQNIGFSNHIKYDICLISTHKPRFFNTKSEFGRNLGMIDSYLIKFLNENSNLKCAILCRSPKNSMNGKFELDYFSSVYGPRVDLIFRDDCEFSTYQGMAQSKLIVTCYSTCGVEAFGWGKKVLFCDYSPDNRFANLDSGLWLLDEEGYGSFSERLNMILLIDQKKYRKITAKYSNFIMKYENNHSCIDKIKSSLHLE